MISDMTPEQFKAERERAGLTAKDFAAMIGVSERAVFYYEHGQRKIPLTVQKLLAVIARLDQKYGLAEKD